MQEIVQFVFTFVFYYFLGLNAFYVLLFCGAIPLVFKRFQETATENISTILTSESMPSISIIIPAYNEEKLIIHSAYNALELTYPSKSVVIVNDGSCDNTMHVLSHEFDLIQVPSIKPFSLVTKKIKTIYQSKKNPYLYVIDKENGGRADAVNAGINVSISHLCLIVDADTIVEKDALLRMIRPFLTNPNIVALGGSIRVLNGCTVKRNNILEINLPHTMIEGVQLVEYLRAFLYGRLGWNQFCGPLIISGAFGLFNRSSIIDVGGFDTTCIGEDFDMTIKLLQQENKKGNKHPISFIPDPIAWTEVPATYEQLKKQRERWHQGLFQVLYKFKYMLFNPTYGWAGFLGLPYLLFGELLEPIIEVIGCIALVIGVMMKWIPWQSAFFFLFVAVGITIFLTIICILLEIATFQRYHRSFDIVKMIGYAFLENCGLRQRSLIWRLKGLWRFFRQSKEW